MYLTFVRSVLVLYVSASLLGCGDSGAVSGAVTDGVAKLRDKATNIIAKNEDDKPVVKDPQSSRKPEHERTILDDIGKPAKPKDVEKVEIITVEATSSAPAADIPPFDRNEWSQWTDNDQDCQDTGTEFLIQKSKDPVVFATEAKCIPLEGRWIDDFTGETYEGAASEIAIHNYVTLREAHDSGGHEWPPLKKREFMNDVDNMAVIGRDALEVLLQQKHTFWDGIKKTHWCEWAKKRKTIKEKWDLRINGKEALIIEGLAEQCGKRKRKPATKNKK